MATEMERRHGIAASIVPEHVWTKLYINGLTREQAAVAHREHTQVLGGLWSSSRVE